MKSSDSPQAHRQPYPLPCRFRQENTAQHEEIMSKAKRRMVSLNWF
jgi:hypothetical protein